MWIWSNARNNKNRSRRFNVNSLSHVLWHADVNPFDAQWNRHLVTWVTDQVHQNKAYARSINATRS